MSAPKKSSPSSPWPRGTKRSTRRRLKSNPTRCERETNSTCSRYFGRASSPLSGRRLVDSWHHLHSRVAPCGRAARPSGSLRLPRRTCPPPRRLATLFKSEEEEGRWWCKKKEKRGKSAKVTNTEKERKKEERNTVIFIIIASLVRHLRARERRRRRKTTTTTTTTTRSSTPAKKNSVHHTYTPPSSSTGSKSSVKIKIILITHRIQKNVPSIGTGSPGTLVVSRSCASWAFLFSARRTREVLRK